MEAGYVMAINELYSLRWFPGEPRAKATVSAVFGGGEHVGDTSLFKGSYAVGNRCRSCKKIIVDE
jgi:hypothetical protein